VSSDLLALGLELSFSAFERAVYASKSFVIALALCRGRLTAHEAAEASHVEVRSQIETWGEVEDSESGPSHEVL
jgi:chaperone required for assembly of F1-ATPase